VVPFTRELWIEREGFMETPPKGYFRLFPGNSVRLRYGYVVKCTGCEKDPQGHVIAVHCEYIPGTRSGTPGADTVKVKGNIHWVSARHAVPGEVRIYERLFTAPQPGRERDFIEDLNAQSKRVITARLEPALRECTPEARFQFERHGYFCADRYDSRPEKPVFNRTVTLRDSWSGTKG
jgi:glutaminyl-tRNA synthetase